MNNEDLIKKSVYQNPNIQEEKKEEEQKQEKKTPSSASTGSNTVVMGKQIYEGNVAKRALKRAGKNKQLKGHVHEIMYTDKQNLKIKNIIAGKKARLSVKPNAIRDDIVVEQGKNIVQRAQLKDTVSKSGVKKTLDQAKSHKYQRTNLMGTIETTAKYNEEAAKIPGKVQKMTSTGISSKDTTRIAKKVLGEKNIVKEIPDIAKNSAGSVKTGAQWSAAIEAVNSGVQVYKGEKNVGEAAVSVVNEAAIGGASTYVGDVAGTATTIALAGTPVAVPAGVAVGVGASYATDKVLRKTEKGIGKKYLQHVEKKEEFKRKEAQLQAYEDDIEQRKAKRIIGNKNVSKKKQQEMDKLREETSGKKSFFKMK